ncbi:Helicase conserved C-terminal domain-containing protein [Lentibacillus persicus]|uniref:Helicase conserved C-terminal domain-containing protein n=1 Tax=Lentibacillus persicus TaxID=640948 RepID=A0A1I1T4L1_9BACI|nr:SNF2-related protein [Lentibacillus persicus]SFD53584.1 Helicase conserved C-terminal domain-containing protein [Lentibacillus persicus]
MRHIDIQKDTSFVNEFEETLHTEGPFSSWKLFQMNYQAALTTMAPSFEGLKALDYLPQMDFMEHQISSARKAIEEMNGRAILADEVGLGKTIEAGLILKEYMLRGLVKKALIIVPASLVNQWAKELNEKFYIPAVTFRKSYPWDQYDVIITSIDTAKRSPHREQILEQDYDMLLVDEAHKLKNHKTKNFAFVKSLKKKYCLLLTATPVQNRLVEIFNLVSILKPGHLGDYDSFLKQYGKDRNSLKEDAYLKQLVQKVMIRNTRQNTQFDHIKRNIETIWLDFGSEEKKVYEQLDNSTDTFPAFSKITLLRELCSSREACYLSLKKMINANTEQKVEPITTAIEQLPQHVKAAKTVELIKQFNDRKVIIFTEYRATQVYLQWYLKENGILSVPYRGGFNKGKKDWMRQLFETKAQVLIATEAGGEGINLQFCNYLINYDLPWNPMRLEQRIGRVHRYGQKNDVHIFNMAIRGTVEEHIMTLLYEKIKLFEQVIGNLDSILAELNINDIESEIQSIFSTSSSSGEAKIKLNNLSSVINLTHQQAEQEEHYGN